MNKGIGSFLLFAVLILAACSGSEPTPVSSPTPDIDATVEARVRAILAMTATATPVVPLGGSGQNANQGSTDASITQPTPTATPMPTPTPMPPPKTANINGHMFQLELADTPEKRVTGLSGRKSLPEDHAMLFILEEEGPGDFWMKDVRIPLDILFLDRDKMVVSVQTMKTERQFPDHTLRHYSSPIPALYAIEMNAGLAEQLEIVVGTVVELQ